MNNLLLDVLALGAILSSVMVITAKNPVISVLFLIAVFVNVAGYLCLLGVAYLGLVYLIVYVGAIAILFLFVIMMLNLRLVELVDTGQEYTKNLPMGAFLGSLFFFELLSILPATYSSPNGSEGPLGILLGIFNWLNTALLGISSDGEQISLDFSNGQEVHAAFNPALTDSSLATFTQIQSIGQGLYTYASLWLVIASVIFLLAMAGPIILCMNPSTSQDSTTTV
ncbi:NADH dehydrogenase subunit 6 [Microbotryomycetes sp. JL221]|nr:NADH dehydrogenase subunit 6 [Microbotryomycetes sp. JL221]